MPITSIASMIPIAQEFISHWTNVNAALGATPLLLKGGYTLANFTTDRTALSASIANVISKGNSRDLAANDRDLKKNAIYSRVAQFRFAVNYRLPGTAYIGEAPVSPQKAAAMGPFVQVLTDVADLWGKINVATGIPGFTAPLLLANGVAKVTFDGEFTALKTAYDTLASAENDLKLAMNTRNPVADKLRARMVEYRNAVIALFGAESTFALSLPNITPRPGHTPIPVNLSGRWDAVLQKAVLNFTLSPDPAVSIYDVRYCSGGKYIAKEEQTVEDDISPNGTYETVTGLVVAGAKASFKVYVVTDTENEAGSNAVTVTRS